MSYTTQDLIDTIKRKAFIPSTQSTFQDADILAIATDELRDNIVPEILKTREEYFLVSVDLQVDPSLGYVRIPSRAIGGAVREVSIVSGDSEYNLARMSIEDKVYANGYSGDGFYIQGNKIYMMSNQACTVRVYFHVRPSVLVLPSAAIQVTGIDRDTGVITTGSIPSSWGSSAVVDLIENNAGFDLLGLDVTCTVGTGQLTLDTADIPAELAVGDWISLRDTSPVPQIPVELFPYLAQSVIVQILESVGDIEASAKAEKKLNDIKDQVLSMVTPRVKGEAKLFVPAKNRGALSSKWTNRR